MDTAADPERTGSDAGSPGQWHEDMLGADFAALALPLAEDRQATLVAHRPQREPGGAADGEAASAAVSGLDDPAAARDAWRPLAPRMSADLLDEVAVLYVHGWSDYFFQAHVARFWTALGARFYALDLDGYGRNLDPDRMERSPLAVTMNPPDPAMMQRPGFTTDLGCYDADLEAALAAIARDAPGLLTV